jgi:hypothetical protein
MKTIEIAIDCGATESGVLGDSDYSITFPSARRLDDFVATVLEYLAEDIGYDAGKGVLVDRATATAAYILAVANTIRQE